MELTAFRKEYAVRTGREWREEAGPPGLGRITGKANKRVDLRGLFMPPLFVYGWSFRRASFGRRAGVQSHVIFYVDFMDPFLSFSHSRTYFRSIMIPYNGDGKIVA